MASNDFTRLMQTRFQVLGVVALSLLALIIYTELERLWRESKPARDHNRLGFGIALMSIAHDVLPDTDRGRAYKSGIINMLVDEPAVDVSVYMKGEEHETLGNSRREGSVER